MSLCCSLCLEWPPPLVNSMAARLHPVIASSRKPFQIPSTHLCCQRQLKDTKETPYGSVSYRPPHLGRHSPVCLPFSLPRPNKTESGTVKVHSCLLDEGWGHRGTHLSSLGSSASPSSNEVVSPSGFYRIVRGVFRFTACSHFLPPPGLYSLGLRSAFFYLLFFRVESQGIAESTAPAALGFLPPCVPTTG